MRKVEALEYARRKVIATGFLPSEVAGQVMKFENRLIEGPGGEVVPMTADGTPFSVAESHNPLDYLLAEILDAAPVHMFRSREQWARRHTVFAHRRTHPVGHASTPAAEATLEQRLGMTTESEANRAPATRTLEEKLLMRPAVPTYPLDELSRRLGRTE
jgi:hypothetical protein